MEFQETDDRVRISWNNRDVRKDRLVTWLLPFVWVTWTSMNVYTWWLAFTIEGAQLRMGLVFFSLLASIGTIVIPSVLMQRLWRETVIVDVAGISRTFSGPLAPRPRLYSWSDISEINFGRVADSESAESMITLNVIRPKATPFWRRREMIGYWLAPPLKEQVFEAISRFVQSHKLDVPLKRLD